MSLYVSEIFDSVQGEGTHVGVPATFIRLAGCDLRCEWCDTKDSWEITSGTELSISNIVENVHYNHVVLTGGEPTLQNLAPVIKALKDHSPPKAQEIKTASHGGHYISIETNGLHAISPDLGLDWITCSPKPGADYVINCNPDELKYVVDDNFSVDVIPVQFRGNIPIWLQPNWFDLARSQKRAYELVMNHTYLKLGFQLHKFYKIQ